MGKVKWKRLRKRGRSFCFVLLPLVGLLMQAGELAHVFFTDTNQTLEDQTGTLLSLIRSISGITKFSEDSYFGLCKI